MYSVPSLVWVADVKSSAKLQAAKPEITKAAGGDAEASLRAERQLKDIAEEAGASSAIAGAAYHNLSICALLRGDLNRAQVMSTSSVLHSPEQAQYSSFSNYLHLLLLEQRSNELSIKVDQSQMALTQQLSALAKQVKEQQDALSSQADAIMSSVAKKAESNREILQEQIKLARADAKVQAEQLLTDIVATAKKQAETLLADQATKAKEAQEKLAEQINAAYRVPADLEPKLSALEEQGLKKENWPGDAAGAQRFSDDLAACIRAIPPLAERDALPRINILRWEAVAFKTINYPPGMDIFSFAESCEGPLDTLPAGVPDALVEKLKTMKAEADASIVAYRQKVVMNAAKEALLGRGDPEKALNDLGYLTDGSGSDKATASEAEELCKSIRILVANKKAVDQTTALRNDMEKIANGVRDRALAQSGYNQLTATANGYLLSWLGNDVSPQVFDQMVALSKDAREKGEAIEKVIVDERNADTKRIMEKQYLCYQAWALGKVQQMQKVIVNTPKIDAMRKKVEGGTGFITTDRDIANARAEEQRLTDECGYGYRSFASAARDLLISINPAFLDSGVLQMYQTTWAATWKTLEDWTVGGENGQEWFAKQAATIPKKGFSDDLTQ